MHTDELVKAFYQREPYPTAEQRDRCYSDILMRLEGKRVATPAKGPRRARWSWGTLAVIVGLGAIGGTGVAYALGGFSSQAHSAFSRSVTIHDHAISRRRTSPSGMQAPPTTVGEANGGQGSDKQVWSGPGPEGTTMAVWVQTDKSNQTCYTLLVSASGGSLDPTKAPLDPQVGCEDTINLDPANDPVSDRSGQLWIGSDGNRFITVVGRAPGAAKLTLVAGSSVVTVPVAGGWYAYWLPYAAHSAGYVEYSYAADGRLIGTSTIPAETPER